MEVFLKTYNEKKDEGYLLEVNVKYLGNLHNYHKDLPFLLERMKTEKVEKPVVNLHDQTKYVIYIRN